MIIKLIQPKMNMRPMDTGLKTRMSPSLGLLTIAELFYKEHTVILENENIEQINFDEKVDIVGITVTVDVMPRAAAISKAFRQKGVPVVAGGIHITAYPKESMKYFDVICIGMAELTWPDIIKDLKRGELKKEYWCKEKIHGHDIKSPAYGFVDKRKYLYTNIISTSRGCPYKCDFCYNSCEEYKSLYINRPIEDVIKDIKTIGKKHIMFIDDNFIGNPKWTMELMKKIKPMKLKWNAAVSANIVHMPKILDEMAETGCQSLFIGFESLSKTAIKKVSKGQNNIQMYEKLVKEIHGRGIMINASFVFGLDGDDKGVFDRTLDWIVKNKIETVTSHILTPYPGTKVYERMMMDGRITDENLSNYNTSHVVYKPEKMSVKELYDGYIDLYKRIYSIKNILKRIPKSKKQILPYLAFNFGYRKFGKLTDKLCQLISYERIGKLGELISRYPIR